VRALAITLGVLAVVVFLTVLIIPFVATPPGMAASGSPWGWMWGWGPFMMLFMALFWILLLGMLVLLGVWLFRQFQGRRPGSSSDSNALRILQERYARGEINGEEYDRMRADLLRDRGE
jgi:putative membrane protein